MKKKIELNRIDYNIRKKEKEIRKNKNSKRFFKLREKTADISEKISGLDKKRKVSKERLEVVEDLIRSFTNQINNGGTNELKKVLGTRCGAKTFKEEFSKAKKIFSFISDQDEVENLRKELQKEKENAENAFKEMLRLIYEDENSRNIEFNKQSFEKFYWQSGWREKIEKRVKDEKRLKEVYKKVDDNEKMILGYFRGKEKFEKRQKELEYFKQSGEYAAIEVEKADKLISDTVEEIKKVVKTVEEYLGNEDTKSIVRCINQIETAKNLKSRLSRFSALKYYYNILLSKATGLIHKFNKKMVEITKQYKQLKIDKEFYSQQIASTDTELEKLRKKKDDVFSETVKEEYKFVSSIFNDLKVLKNQRDIINEGFFSF